MKRLMCFLIVLSGVCGLVQADEFQDDICEDDAIYGENTVFRNCFNSSWFPDRSLFMDGLVIDKNENNMKVARYKSFFDQKRQKLVRAEKPYDKLKGFSVGDKVFFSISVKAEIEGAEKPIIYVWSKEDDKPNEYGMLKIKNYHNPYWRKFCVPVGSLRYSKGMGDFSVFIKTNKKDVGKFKGVVSVRDMEFVKSCPGSQGDSYISYLGGESESFRYGNSYYQGLDHNYVYAKNKATDFNIGSREFGRVNEITNNDVNGSEQVVHKTVFVRVIRGSMLPSPGNVTETRVVYRDVVKQFSSDVVGEGENTVRPFLVWTSSGGANSISGIKEFKSGVNANVAFADSDAWLDGGWYKMSFSNMGNILFSVTEYKAPLMVEFFSP